MSEYDNTSDEPVRMGWLEAALFADEMEAAVAPGTITITGKDATGSTVSETIHLGASGDANKLAIGGFIENGGIAIVADNAPETFYLPTNASLELKPGQSATMLPGQPYTIRMNMDNTAAQPSMANMYVGDVPWGYNPPPDPWRVVGTPLMVGGEPYQSRPAPDTLTEERIRAMVCKWLRDDPEIRAIINGEQDGIVDVKHRRRVRQFDEGGYEWRGVLYRVDKEDEL